MNHLEGGPRRPDNRDHRGRKNTNPREAGEGTRELSKPQGEQQPHSGGVDKPELHPPEPEEEMSELAIENDKFFRKVAKLIDPQPLSEDFHKRLKERLRHVSQEKQEGKLR